jgi:hypothetical protein
MPNTDAHRRELWIGLVLSLCAHAGAGGLAVMTNVGSGQAPASDELVVDIAVVEETVEEPDDPLRPGIVESDAQTPNWLGFDTPTEHSAPESEVEQSAMALQEESARDEETEKEEGERAAEREEAVRALLASAMSLAEAWADAARGVGVAEDSSQALPAGEGVEGEAAVAAGQGAAPGAATVPAAGAERDGTSSEGAEDSSPGIITDKEALAAALKSAPALTPGRVLAAEGLEISTRRPEWPRTVQLTARPRNPVIWITFGRNGRVLRAGFLSDGQRLFDTGDESVNEPLMNAVYRWTAKGKAIEALSDKPEAGVTIRVRVLLIG